MVFLLPNDHQLLLKLNQPLEILIPEHLRVEFHFLEALLEIQWLFLPAPPTLILQFPSPQPANLQDQILLPWIFCIFIIAKIYPKDLHVPYLFHWELSSLIQDGRLWMEPILSSLKDQYSFSLWHLLSAPVSNWLWGRNSLHAWWLMSRLGSKVLECDLEHKIR